MRSDRVLRQRGQGGRKTGHRNIQVHRCRRYSTHPRGGRAELREGTRACQMRRHSRTSRHRYPPTRPAQGRPHERTPCMKRLAVKIAYLGDGFSGSQVQPSSRTVEGEVLENLKLITKLDAETLDLRFSSRTDKGVNALGNAISFHTELEGHIILKALNSVSDGVFYRSFCEIDEDMNIRHASRRRYRYILPYDGRDMDL